ncbi:unnamed protein product [Lymnaea stagnalis]|uniref:Uncharacterized protein n=1 Tax=Lymnaea stagnalis TaxID=6523 RepID=A0AAV2H196_LYMST
MAARLSEMQALYDRCILIVEADRVKAGQEKSKKTWHHNKYVDTTMSQIIQIRVKIYFSDSMDQTAALLSELCHIEAKKGRALTVPTSLNSRQEEILKFILTIPRVTVPQALNLVHHYHSIAELISSSPGAIQERGRMTAESAQSVHQFLHHEFDLQMMPDSK